MHRNFVIPHFGLVNALIVRLFNEYKCDWEFVN